MSSFMMHTKPFIFSVLKKKWKYEPTFAMCNRLILGYGVWGLGWGVGWGKTPKPPPWVGLGWGVALGAWFQAGHGAGEQADMAGYEWPIQTSRWVGHASQATPTIPPSKWV
ncbi:hypothetical protein HanRHA438_Chr10g0459291 [Helianthus annuus]|nr:hypothetical protein HanRHA438_Chr10g0459291 [Helianthus annuus]